jgi:hypothetical protein
MNRRAGGQSAAGIGVRLSWPPDVRNQARDPRRGRRLAPAAIPAAAGSEVMSSAADGVAHHAEQYQDGADNQDNDANRPDNGDMRNETDDKKDDTENDQEDS